jgi:hypothetical protein
VTGRPVAISDEAMAQLSVSLSRSTRATGPGSLRLSLPSLMVTRRSMSAWSIVWLPRCSAGILALHVVPAGCGFDKLIRHGCDSCPRPPA